jgi:hypothetical protein
LPVYALYSKVSPSPLSTCNPVFKRCLLAGLPQSLVMILKFLYPFAIRYQAAPVVLSNVHHSNFLYYAQFPLQKSAVRHPEELYFLNLLLLYSKVYRSGCLYCLKKNLPLTNLMFLTSHQSLQRRLLFVNYFICDI